jgi:tripartite-type tricarboxylate transporter receptor subunit TctC
MTKNKTSLLGRVALSLALLSGGAAHADYPERAVKLVAPYAPGGSADMLARALAAELGKELGQAVVVENKPGANTQLAATAVARGPADGYTLLLASSASMVLNPLLYRKLNYEPQKDFRLLSVVAEAPLVVVAGDKVPAQNLKDFSAYAKANAGRLNDGSVGLGNPLQLATEMLKGELQIELTHVPYNGSAPALAALMAGDTQLMIDVVSTSLPHLRAGKLRALAVTGSERVKALPEVPTVAEAGFPGFHAATWFGIAVPAGTPAPVATRVQAAVHKAMLSASLRSLLDTQSLLAQPARSDAELGRYIERDRSNWGKVIRAHNITLE